MKARIILTALIALCLGSVCRSQNLTDLIISEVQVDSVLLDNGYGVKSPWIEILNTSGGTVKFGGCFLSDERTNLRKYYISKRDAASVVGPKQLVVFYADAFTEGGTFHTNFSLERGSTVYLVSNDGRTVIDSLKVPVDLEPGKSIARFSHDAKDLIFDDTHAAVPTPGIYNADGVGQTKAEHIAEVDPHGWTITIVSVSVVFGALLLLFIAYTIVGRICTTDFKKYFAAFRKKFKKGGKAGKGNADVDNEVAAAIALALKLNGSDETEAAIALALHLYLSESVHDKESYRITIRRKR